MSSAQGISLAEHDLAVTHPSLHDMHVLKHRDMFSVFHVSGDIPTDADTPAGLFANDTRILSRWRFLLHGARLKFLSGGLDRNGLVMASHVTNYAFTDRQGHPIVENAISVNREKFIHNETLYERVTLANHGMTETVFNVSLRFGSDFKDIFEVRGMQRSKKGVHYDTFCGVDYCLTTYSGLDGHDRYCQIRFSRRPELMSLNEAVFQVTLAPKEEWELICRVSAVKEDLPEQNYGLALAHAREDLEGKTRKWLQVHTDNEFFDSWLDASCKAVSLLVTDMPTGPYPYAGIPWFSVPFGRDGIITALQVLPFNPDIARGVLMYLAENQATDYVDFREAEPGRILHETRKGEMAFTGEVPFQKYYGSVDSTPLFIMLAGAYHETCDDRDFIGRLMPSLRAAQRWLEKDGSRGGDGFTRYACHSENGLFTQGWKDSHDSVFHADGRIAEPPIALCEVQGYTYAAYKTMADLLDLVGDTHEAGHLRARAKALYDKFNDVFWDEQMGGYVMALDAHGQPCRVRSSNVGHLLYCGIVPEDRAECVVRMLTGPEFFSGWGIRTIGTNEARYSPLSYHNGSVWPHDTSIIAAGFARYGYYAEAAQILQALYQTAQNVGRMLLPELICGFQKMRDDGVVLYPTACLPQAWSSAAGFMALSAALGLRSRNGKLDAARAAPVEGLFQTLELWNGSEKVFPV